MTTALRAVTRADLPQLASWRNDPELQQRTREWRPLTDVDQEAWLQRISGPHRRDFMFVVETTTEHSVHPVPIGVVGLCDWDAINATAEISFYIGPRWARQHGHATQALTGLIQWGFDVLRLERIWAESFETADPAHRVMVRLGFVKEGRLRLHVWKNGQRLDSLMFGLLKDEWSARRKAPAA